MELNLRQAQENELRVLSSIYTNLLKDLRSKREKRSRPPCFSLTITPLRSNSTIAQQTDDPTFDLIVRETSLYPNEAPEISLVNPRNLPGDALKLCELELRNIIERNLGEDMIFILAQYAQTFLEEYRPMKHTENTVRSINEQALENDEQLIEKEINALREKHSEEKKNKRRGQSNSLSVSHKRLARILSESNVEFDVPTKIKVRRGHLLHKETHANICDHTLYMSYLCTHVETADVYCLYEWNFIRPQDDQESITLEDFCAQYRQAIGNIEDDLRRLIALRHNHLCKIIAYRFILHETAVYTFRVLTEWPQANSLEVFDSCPVSEPLLRKIAASLCDTLAYLHSQSIVHHSINRKSIYLCASGLKITGTEFFRSLNDLSILFYEGQPPRKLNSFPKTDIYDMGLLLLDLSTGRIHDSILDIPTSFSDELRDFLQSCANCDMLNTLMSHRFLLNSAESQINLDSLTSDTYDRENSSANSSSEDMLVSPKSRLKSDFEVIGILGKGGFGHVFKAQNKLDGCYYAVKQILLKSSNKSVNRKITREVKLLSKLNHQNIVRYYSTWTEQTSLKNEPPSMTSLSATKSVRSGKKKPMNADSLRREIHRQIPELSSSNESPKEQEISNDSHSSNTASSDDEGGVFDASIYHQDDRSDDLVKFAYEDDDDDEKARDVKQQKQKDRSNSSSSSSVEHGRDDARLKRVLFIQMEYCEGNTLKQLIERGILQKKPKMIWLLLREILEGLKHMHLKGIIHRDLKPGNILLDSNGHAKIGDLGLATINKLSGYTDTMNPPEERVSSRSSWSMDLKDGGVMSTLVGTTFYMAPELLSGKRIAPTEKVDIYSLGITFFEMCYPFNTLMERAKILSELRRADIRVPDYFQQKSFSRHYELVSQMLNHDPEKRPSAHTLLESNIIPFEQEEKFEQLLDRMINSTNNDLQSFYYRKTIAKLFQRKNNVALDATFDPDTQLDLNKLSFYHRESRSYNALRNILIKIFEKYGAFQIRLPLFIPDTHLYHKNECSNLKFMSSTGLLVSLPFDSKIPLARFISRCVSHFGFNGVNTFKCFQISNVFRESLSEMHPRELTECGFDIVFTQSTCLPDAEVLAVCQDVLEELQIQKERNVFIRINHSHLLHAILVYFDVPSEKITPIIAGLHKGRFDSHHSTIYMYLIENGINELIAKRIEIILSKDGPFDDVVMDLKSFTKANTEGSKMLKNIMEELETIVKYARAFGVNMPIYLTLRFFTLNPILDSNSFSGFMFQITSLVQRKKRITYEVYAGGGRYDPLLAQFRRPSQKNLQNDLPHIVGVSFDVERLLQYSLTSRTAGSISLMNMAKGCDTVICLSSQPMDFLRLRLELITNGTAVATLYELPPTFEMLDDYCVACEYNRLIYRPADSCDEAFRLRTYENGKVNTVKRFLGSQIVQLLRNDNANTTLTNSSSGSILTTLHNELEPMIPQQVTNTPGGSSIKNAPSLPSLFTNNESISVGAQLNTYLFFIDPMFKSISKKKIENQVQYKLSTLSSLFTSKSRIEVFVFDLSDSILTTIVSTLSLEDEMSFDSSLRTILEKLAIRSQEVIRRFGEQVKELRFLRRSKLFVISSYKTDFYRFMAAFT